MCYVLDFDPQIHIIFKRNKFIKTFKNSSSSLGVWKSFIFIVTLLTFLDGIKRLFPHLQSYHTVPGASTEALLPNWKANSLQVPVQYFLSLTEWAFPKLGFFPHCLEMRPITPVLFASPPLSYPDLPLPS